MERGNLGLHDKGNEQVEKPRGKIPMAGRGAEELVVVMKCL